MYYAKDSLSAVNAHKSISSLLKPGAHNIPVTRRIGRDAKDRLLSGSLRKTFPTLTC